MAAKIKRDCNFFDIILANPPFKGSIDESEMSDKFKITSKKTEILFLELIYNVLNNGGKGGVIIPEGILFGNSNAHKKIRKLLLEKCRLDAVIKMPSGVFKPYAGVSTGTLIFTKGEPTKKVLFYEMEKDGYSLDDKRNFIDGKGDIPDIIDKFKRKDSLELTDRTQKCFFVPGSCFLFKVISCWEILCHKNPHRWGIIKYFLSTSSISRVLVRGKLHHYYANS